MVQSRSLKPVQRRLLVPLAIVLLLLVSGYTAALLSLQQDHLDRSNRTILEHVSRSIETGLTVQTRRMESLIDELLDAKSLRDGLKTGDRLRLLADYETTFIQFRQLYNITHFYFHRFDEVNLLRLHEPQRYGDRISRFTLREADRSRTTVAGLELGPLGTFTLRVVKPVFEGATLIGFLELGKEIKNFLEILRGQYGVELAVILNKTLLEQAQWEAGMRMLGRQPDWDRFSQGVLTYSSLPNVSVN